MSEVKLDETYWKCDLCGERLSTTCKTAAGFWNMQAERHEMIDYIQRGGLDNGKEGKTSHFFSTVFTICDKCVKRLMDVRPLRDGHLKILKLIHYWFSDLNYLEDGRDLNKDVFTKAMKWLWKKFKDK